MEFQKLTNRERWKSEEWLILTFTLNYLKYKELRKSEGWLILATSPLTPSFSKSYKGSEGKNQKIKIFFFYIPTILCYIYFFFSSNFFFSGNNPSSFKLLENQGLKGEGCILHDPSLFLHFFSNYLKNQGFKGEGCILPFFVVNFEKGGIMDKQTTLTELITTLSTPEKVERGTENSVYKEIEATEKRLIAEFRKIIDNPDAGKVFIEIDAGYKVLKIPLTEFAQSNIDMMQIVKETKIEGDENRIRQIWNEFFDDVRKNLERAKSLLSQYLDNNNPSLPDESISVWLDFLISNFKDIKWNDNAPKDMRDKAFKIIVKLDKIKRERKTKSEFKQIIDKGFEVLNEMRKSLNLEPF